MLNIQEKRKKTKSYSDTGNRTPSCRVRGGNVSRYTISDWEGTTLAKPTMSGSIDLDANHCTLHSLHTN